MLLTRTAIFTVLPIRAAQAAEGECVAEVAGKQDALYMPESSVLGTPAIIFVG